MMGATHETEITIAQLCATVLKRKPNTVRMAWSRNGLANWDVRRVVTPDELRVITEYYSTLPAPSGKPGKPAPLPIQVRPPAPDPTPAGDTSPAPPPAPSNEAQAVITESATPRWLKIVLLGVATVIPTAASVKNMYLTAMQVSEDHVTAFFYTALLAATPISFAIAGVKRLWAILVAVLLITFEVFCNTTRIYDGLISGAHGNPVRFLGTVTDIFNTGTHGTALGIGSFIGIMIAAAQFSSLFSLKKII